MVDQNSNGLAVNIPLYCQFVSANGTFLRDTTLELNKFCTYILDRDERKIVAQLWRTTIWGRFSPKIVLWLWCSLSKNCGRGWGCGGQNLKIVVVVGVVVVIFGKIVLGLGL